MTTNAMREKSIPDLRELAQPPGYWLSGNPDAEQRNAALAELCHRGQMDPCDKPFTWGTIIETHEVGDFAVVEYVRDHPIHNAPPEPEDTRHFHSYVRTEGEWQDTSHGHRDLDSALVFVLAYKHLHASEGVNSAANNAGRAETFFMRMIRARSD